MFASMVRFLAYGWVHDLFATPKVHFKYWGFEWLPVLPEPLMIALFAMLAVLALCVAAGFFFRPAALLFAVGFTYIQLADASNYLNHYYLASLLAFLLALSPAGSRRDSVPVVWLWIFRFQVGVVYTFASLAKAQPDWLLHGQPLGLWLSEHTGMPVLGWFFSWQHAALIMSWAGFLFDLTIPWFLSWSKARPFAFCVVIFFHVVTRALFPIGMFPVIMVVSAMVFFSPSWPRRIIGGVSSLEAPKFGKFPAALAAVYCTLQLLLPLRHWIYGGDVLWDEQGMRFSWRVMVREKNGSVELEVIEKKSGKTHLVSPTKYLTRAQEREMSGQPAMILQFAHLVRDDFEARGLGPVEVRARALVSLNGRRAQLLVDPTVDLAQVEDGLLPASWIAAAPSEDPPQLKPVASR